MAGHIEDRWYRDLADASGKVRKVKKDRYGHGKRYRARYTAPNGVERSRSFRDGEKEKARTWLARMEADISRGQYLDPKAGNVLFEDYAKDYLGSLTIEASSLEATEQRLRLHAFPYLGDRPINAVQPVDIRKWTKNLQDAALGASYQQVIFAHVSAVFAAAVDDGLVSRNPCRSRSVKAPKSDKRKVAPWTVQRVLAVREQLPSRYRIAVDIGAGCGLRQGEILGLAVEDVDFLDGSVRVVRQVKKARSQLFFAPPKGGKERDVPLPDEVAERLTQHITQHPPVEVTLPWKRPDGPPVTTALLISNQYRNAVNRNSFNDKLWKPALVGAGVIPERELGKPYSPSREHGMHALRHFYASVLLDAGESVKALAEYLGHADPGFTLRTYTHLMPSSQQRTRVAVDAAFGRTAPPDSDERPVTSPPTPPTPPEG